MINFQETMAKLIAPASTGGEMSGRPAIIEAAAAACQGEDRIITFADLELLVSRACYEYKRCGVTAGDPVLLCSPNSANLIACILAAWSLGATAIPVDFRLTQGEVENIAGKVKPKIVYTPGFLLPAFAAVTPEVLSSGTVALNAELLQNLKPEACGLVILTSGTTGMPKGAVHDLGSLVENVHEIASVFGLAGGKSALLPLPVSHIFGVEVLLAFLCMGGSVALADFSASAFWTTVERIKPSLVVGVPTIYGALLSLPHPGPVCRSVDFYLSGGAPLGAGLSRDFEQKFGKHIVQGYGTTETKIISINKDGPVESVGRAIPSVKIEIVNESDAVLPEGETGEIRVAGNCLMKEYLNQSELTAKVLHNGHYHTGDIGYIKDGWIYISGRSKEMIIVAGNKIFPQEVESVLRQHPLAAEVAVIGMPNKKLGQIVKAIVVVPTGAWSDHLTAEAAGIKAAKANLKASFREFCLQNLKRELRPMDWDFRPAGKPLPKTHTGKIDKKKLQGAAS